MSYTLATKMSSWFADDFDDLKNAFAKRNITLDSPSLDGFVRRLSFQNGKQVFFTADALPLNSAGAASLARDKLATYQVLSAIGLAVPRGFAFFAREFRDQQTKVEPQLLFKNLLATINQCFPRIGEKNCKLIVKPGQGSRGYMVSPPCETLLEVELWAQKVLTMWPYGIVQEYIEGPEYRVVLLDGHPLVVYKKSRSEFENKQHVLKTKSSVRGDTGKLIPLNAVPDEVVRIAQRATEALGLRYSGVDVCLPRDEPPARILEINSNPGFDALDKDANFDRKHLADKISNAICAVFA